MLADIVCDDEFSQMKSGNLAFSGKQKLTMLVSLRHLPADDPCGGALVRSGHLIRCPPWAGGSTSSPPFFSASILIAPHQPDAGVQLRGDLPERGAGSHRGGPGGGGGARHPMW